MSSKIVLPDLLEHGLKAVICGTAVTWESAKAKAYYAYEGNCFYETLARLKFTPIQLQPSDYRKLLDYGIGLTDLAKYKIGSDKTLKPEDFDIPGLIEKVAKYKPKILCFNGKRSAAEFYGFGEKTQKINYGLQKEAIDTTKVFVTYSTAENAKENWIEEHWVEFKILIDK